MNEKELNATILEKQATPTTAELTVSSKAKCRVSETMKARMQEMKAKVRNALYYNLYFLLG